MEHNIDKCITPGQIMKNAHSQNTCLVSGSACMGFKQHVADRLVLH